MALRLTAACRSFQSLFKRSAAQIFLIDWLHCFRILLSWHKVEIQFIMDCSDVGGARFKMCVPCSELSRKITTAKACIMQPSTLYRYWFEPKTLNSIRQKFIKIAQVITNCLWLILSEKIVALNIGVLFVHFSLKIAGDLKNDLRAMRFSAFSRLQLKSLHTPHLSFD